MAGYSRQSTSDIVPTAVVKAAPINAEYNKLRDAFTFSSSATTGHRHDGDSDEGSYVPLIADPDKKNHISVDTSNNRHGVFVEVSANAVEQVRFQDGLVVPVTDNDIDLGTSSLEFKDIFIDGTAKIDTVSIGDNDRTVIVDNSYTVSSGDLTVDVAGDIILDAGGANVTIKDDGTSILDIVNSTGDVELTVSTADKNFKIKGTDASSGITAVDIDMADAGTVTLNHDLVLPDNGIIKLGAGTDLSLTSDGTNAVIAAPNGTLTVDVNADITIDAGGADILLKDGGTDYGSLTNNGNNLVIKSGTTTAASFTGANVDFAGTVDVTSTLTADAGLTVAGATALNGGLTMDTNKFTVADTSGNVVTAGTLTATGLTTLNGGLTVNGGNLDMNGNVDISGNLVVNGTVTTLDTTNTTIKDLLIELGTGTTGTPGNDAGLVIERGDSANAFIGYDESADKFIVGTGTFTGASTGNLSITKGVIQAGVDFSSSSITDGTTSIAGFKDEDDFASDSATHLATQQSIKAYVATIAGQSNNVVGLTSTAAELNLLDGSAVTPTTLTLADDDGIVMLDLSAATTKNIRADNLATYFTSKANVAGSTTTFTNKTFDQDATGNSITNLANASIKSGAAIDATKIANGTVTSTEFQFIGNLSSDAQTQLNAKQAVVSGVSDTEIGYLDGVSSAIQTQLDAKQAVVSGVDNTEIGYLNGVTSAIQTQLDAKATTGKAIAMAIVFG